MNFMLEIRKLNRLKMTRTLLILVFTFMGIVNCANAQIIDQGACGENLIWILTSDGVLTINGSGAMYGYGYPNTAPWIYYYDQIKNIVIGNEVTTIGSMAFIGSDPNNKLTSIVIGNSVTEIGNGAFFGTTVASLIIPNSVTTIGVSAFQQSINLTSIVIGSSVITIGPTAFFKCSKLDTIVNKATTPPAFGGYNIFTDISTTAKVIVPCYTSSAYHNSSWGNIFTDFIEDCSNNGINETIQSKKINIYPNPSNNKIYIDNENFNTIKLYDMLGKEVLNQDTNGKTEINISHLPQGVYSVRILSNGKVIGNSKIVKQ